MELFEYEDLGAFRYSKHSDETAHSFLVTHIDHGAFSADKHDLGVVREPVRSRRFPNSVPQWYAVVSLEPDSMKWGGMPTRPFEKREDAAFWLLGMYDCMNIKFRTAREALSEELRRRTTLCHHCGSVAVPDPDKAPEEYRKSGGWSTICAGCGRHVRQQTVNGRHTWS